jgi:phenylacetate-CoA ligase
MLGADAETRFHLLMETAGNSPFWRRRGLAKATDADRNFSALEPVTKAEILVEQATAKPYGLIPAVPSNRLVRVHQSSGTSGNPLVWADTAEDWSRLLAQWDQLFQIAQVTEGDRFFFPFSFGPFLGFWSAFESVARSGRFCLAGGGLSSIARLRFIEDHRITVVLTTPSYASHLADLAAKAEIELAGGPVRLLILAGEPGASMPGVKARLEQAWGAIVLDHHGMTEVGPVSMECPLAKGELHLLDDWYLVEEGALSSDLGEESQDKNGISELVLTPFARRGMPLIRYRTGDRVRLVEGICRCGKAGTRLVGGILGRLDDMMIVRGNNVYPQAIEDWIWKHPEVNDFQGKLMESSGLSKLVLFVEFNAQENFHSEMAKRLAQGFADRFLFQVDVVSVLPGTIPKSEHKAKRWIRGK